MFSPPGSSLHYLIYRHVHQQSCMSQAILLTGASMGQLMIIDVIKKIDTKEVEVLVVVTREQDPCQL